MLSLRLSALLLLGVPAPVIAQDMAAPAPAARDVVTAPPAPVDRGEITMAAYRARTQLIKPCPRGPSVDIIVCGRWLSENVRSRLPLPLDPSESTGIARGEIPTANASYGKSGGCSVVGGQTTGCTGSFEGAKAIDVMVKAVSALIDPDGDYSPPPVLPDRFRGAGRH